MSVLKIGDRAAGAIKSGGTTRRAAKMVTVDLDHPDIEAYIDWKVVEEQKVAALVTGSKLRSEEHTSELQSLMRISYAVFCLKKKNNENGRTMLIQWKDHTKPKHNSTKQSN